MFFSHNKTARPGRTKTLKQWKVFILLFVAATGIRIQAEDESAISLDPMQGNSDVINEFVKSKGYENSIVFDASNIKMYWTDRSVVSKKEEILLLLNQDKNTFKSNPFPVQIANVNVTLDCVIDIISKKQNINFSVLDNNLKPVSSTASSDSFLDYNVSSQSFHLEDIPQFRFNLVFNSAKDPSLVIDKIVISFIPNKSFLTGPGCINITNDNVVSSTVDIQKKDDDTFSVSIKGTGTLGTFVSNNRIYVSDNTITQSIVIKNTGEVPVTVRVGFAVYTKDMRRITTRNSILKNEVIHILSSEAKSKSIIVDKCPDWVPYSSLAYDAKEDLSDFPNFNFSESRIDDIKELEDGKAEIIFAKPLVNPIPQGTSARVQRGSAWDYLYLNYKTIPVGEEVVIKSTIKKDDEFYEFSSKALCKGTYYISPAVRIETKDGKEHNAVDISDYVVQY